MTTLPEAGGTEAPDPTTEDLDLLPVAEQVQRVLAGDDRVVTAVAEARDGLTSAITRITGLVRAGGRLVYVGAGSAGRTAALDAAEVGPTFGVRPDVVHAVVAGGLAVLADAAEGLEDDGAAGAADVARLGLGPADALVAVSASGRTPYTVAAARTARADGAYTVALVNNPGSELATTCDLAIEVLTGPEAVAGSTRLRAGTAQKIVLNTLSTLVMVGAGRTYGNRMIGVRPDNDKLRARAGRILTDLTGVGEDEAQAALDATGGTPPALVVLLTGATPELAVATLAEQDGDVRAAVRALVGGAP